jgi:hypothetical protein
MAKLEPKLTALLLVILSLTGCQMKTFESAQAFKIAIETAFSQTQGFHPITCLPDSLKLSPGTVESCFAAKLEPFEFTEQINAKLIEFSEPYNPWTEDYGNTYAEFRTMDKKYLAGLNYVPKNLSDYILNGKVIELKHYPPLKEFKAYLSIIVSAYHQ